MRRPLKITSRTSSITNSFIQAIVPSIDPSPEERRQALAILGLTPDAMSCVYCGSKTTDWDHLRPLVRNKRPTGYVNEIRNLVPSCGPCNQSKSGRDWRAWMTGNAKGSPTRRGIPDIADRIKRLDEFERWGKIDALNLADFVDPDDWNKHWANLDAILDAMRAAQKHADIVRDAVKRRLLSAEREA